MRRGTAITQAPAQASAGFQRSFCLACSGVCFWSRHGSSGSTGEAFGAMTAERFRIAASRTRSDGCSVCSRRNGTCAWPSRCRSVRRRPKAGRRRAPAGFTRISPEDQDVHRKAQRFARLLVDEIKLYNQAKVAEGRKNKDLYDRLKEMIEKSRATYQKRYGNTVAASGNYFQHEIIRSLAEDDLSIMGANFRQ